MTKEQLRSQYFQQVKEYRANTQTGEVEKKIKKIKENISTFFSRPPVIANIPNIKYARRHFSWLAPLSFKKSTLPGLRIMAYQPLKSEIPILDLLGQVECEIFIPEIRGKTLIPRSLKRGEVGKIRNMDFIIVPGLYVTQKGYRLGRGGGYYDRLLCDFPAPKTLFVGYDWQVIDEIPLEPWDKPFGHLITESMIRSV